MKKIIFILMMFASVFAAHSVNAEALKREAFAELLLPAIENSIAEGDLRIKDIENPSQAILKAVSTGALSLDGDGCFNPEEEVLECDFLKSIVTVWEIRMGELDAPALGGYLSGYSLLTGLEKNIVDKAVMIGIAPEDGKIQKDRAVDKTAAVIYMEKLFKAIEIMKNHGGTDFITSFRNSEGITGTPENKITFFASLNAPPEYDSVTLVMALYCDDRLTDVVHKSYTGLKNSDFSIMHTALDIPEEGENVRCKVFMLDSLSGQKPIYEYRLLSR